MPMKSWITLLCCIVIGGCAYHPYQYQTSCCDDANVDFLTKKYCSPKEKTCTTPCLVKCSD